MKKSDEERLKKIISTWESLPIIVTVIYEEMDPFVEEIRRILVEIQNKRDK